MSLAPSDSTEVRRWVGPLLGLDAPRQSHVRLDGALVPVERGAKEPFDFARYQKLCEQLHGPAFADPSGNGHGGANGNVNDPVNGS